MPQLRLSTLLQLWGPSAYVNETPLSLCSCSPGPALRLAGEVGGRIHMSAWPPIPLSPSGKLAPQDLNIPFVTLIPFSCRAAGPLLPGKCGQDSKLALDRVLGRALGRASSPAWSLRALASSLRNHSTSHPLFLILGVGFFKFHV